MTRQIAQLEEHFGVRLLHRTTRRLSLTDDGQGLLERARNLLEDATALEDLVRGHGNGVAGLVRLGVSVSGALFLAPRLPSLLTLHPGLEVELDVSDQRHDLIENRIDVALRAGEIDDTSLIARRIGVISPILVAAPTYLARAGWPVRPDDLTRHVCIGDSSSGRPLTWRFIGPDGPIGVPVHGVISVNNSEVACQIALAGHGIAHLPGFQVLDYLREGRLVQILDDHPAAGTPINLVYPSRRNLAARTRVLMEFLTEQVRDAMIVLTERVRRNSAA